ncbi:MAG: GNAT family N-acetyltransferase [Clostridia bacterium]|nr:GNAT family N-acetyltransferase [Clostridia bacterium]
MAQLKMYYLPETPFEEEALPEGYSYSKYDPEKDLHKWCDCLRNGNLIGERTDEEMFRDEITNFKVINAAEDILFLDFNGEHIGTATAFVYPDTNLGDMHQVGIREDHRGKGLARYLSQIVIKTLRERNVKMIALTTGEGRPAAVRSYLKAGFKPVEYDYGMEDRWRAFMQKYGIEKLDMLYDDGSFYKTILKDDVPKRVKIGVLGAGRGTAVMHYCKISSNAELRAVCDFDETYLNKVKKDFGDGVSYYSDFDEFIKADFDLVVLANYANKHAPYAVKALSAGKHVLSELLPVQNMKEAVELVEAVENSGKKYIYAENCCYMPAPKKMRKLFKEGHMGEFLYGEGEYLHNCENDWYLHCHADKNHWRNTMTTFFYCTHSLGPLIHISGKRPVSVSGFEAPYNKKMLRMGAKGAPFGLEIVTLENGAILKSLHGVGSVKYSLWYGVQGEMGVMESERNVLEKDGVQKLYMQGDSKEGSDDGLWSDTDTSDGLTEMAAGFDHGGGDYYLFYNACEAINGNEQADVIDVYEALDMALPGLFAFFSALENGAPMEIPDLRKKEQRDRYRNDTRCTDPECAGDMLLPSCSKVTPDIPDEIYDVMKQKRDKHFSENK